MLIIDVEHENNNVIIVFARFNRTYLCLLISNDIYQILCYTTEEWTGKKRLFY